MSTYSLGIDFGTNSARCLIVRLDDGAEIGSCVFPFPSGDDGILLDEREPECARQHPADYLAAIEHSVRGAIAEATQNDSEFAPEAVCGIGVDTTGSTPLPVDELGQPLALQSKFANRLSAMAWLWKDHTALAEAAEITALAQKIRPQFLAKCGGTYSSEWFWSKIWHCLRSDPEVFHAAHTWIECADWIPAILTGTPENPKRGICPAGHKAMFHKDWGGYPDAEFLGQLDPELGKLRGKLPNTTYNVSEIAGYLVPEWAERTGLNVSTPVAVGAVDAHLGAVGSGVRPGTLVRIIGTSTCDMAVWPLNQNLPDIPGICGIVPESILPGMYGLEAGQSAVGDIFNWFTDVMEAGSHEQLSHEAAKLKPGQSGLLALDWNNGNRTILVDQRLTGLLLGQTLRTKPYEVYRALIEATAFGALMIMQRFEEYGVQIKRVVNCGGIAEKNPLVMQIYADVTGREMNISRSAQTCALGSAICGAVVGRAFPSFAAAQEALCGVKETVYRPNPAAHDVYSGLFELYSLLHDAFGRRDRQLELYLVMKRLLEIRDQALV